MSQPLLRACLPLPLLLALVAGIGLLPLLPRGARAHTVETLDGTVHEGRIVLEDDERVVIATTFEGDVTVPKAEVKKIDRTVPPLRDQLRFRAERAKDDVAALLELHRWAKEKGFGPELTEILDRVVAIDPGNARAHKLLGHEKVDGVWMTPAEKALHEQEKLEAEKRAQGLVPYEGRWVTPEEKDALEKGLVRDGEEWVTEEEYHRRRGENLVDGQWVRAGEAEGKAWHDEVSLAKVTTSYQWSPHFDLLFDVEVEQADSVRTAAEAAFEAFRQTLRPTPEDYPATVEGRIRLHLFQKLPAYARFAEFFEGKERCSELVPGWLPAVKRQHSFWWIQPVGLVGVYKFPNVPRTFVSNAVHAAGLVLLTRYRFNFRFPSAWMLEGFAYFLEMESLGYSDTFSLARQGTGAAAAGGQPAWADSDKWRAELKKLVTDGSDPAIKRIAQMQADQLGYVELVKSWSVIECLVRLDRAKFEAWVKAGKDREKGPEVALQEVYGWQWRDLDRVWREYVAADFRHGVPPVPGAPGAPGSPPRTPGGSRSDVSPALPVRPATPRGPPPRPPPPGPPGPGGGGGARPRPRSAVDLLPRAGPGDRGRDRRPDRGLRRPERGRRRAGRARPPLRDVERAPPARRPHRGRHGTPERAPRVERLPDRLGAPGALGQRPRTLAPRPRPHPDPGRERRALPAGLRRAGPGRLPGPVLRARPAGPDRRSSSSACPAWRCAGTSRRRSSRSGGGWRIPTPACGWPPRWRSGSPGPRTPGSCSARRRGFAPPPTSRSGAWSDAKPCSSPWASFPAGATRTSSLPRWSRTRRTSGRRRPSRPPSRPWATLLRPG